MTRHGRRVAAVALAVTLVLGACTDSDDTATEADPTNEESSPRDVQVATGGAADLDLTASQRARDVGLVFQTGGFLVTVGTVVHDTADDSLHVGLRFRNLGDSWAVPQPEAVLVIDGAEHRISLSGLPRVPPLHETELTGTAPTAGGDPMAQGTLRFGRADESSTTIELSSGTGDGFGPPVPITLDEWGQIGKHTVHLVSGELLADSVRGPRAPAGHRVLRVGFDEYSSTSAPVNGFHAVDHFVLRWPDGTVVDPLGGSTGRGVLSWTASTGGSVDFPVPAEPDGAYEVLLAGVGRNSFSLLSPDQVERVAIPIAVPPDLASGPATVDVDLTPLPIPHLPERGATTSAVIDVELDVPEVNVPGFTFTATRLRWDPATETARVEGEARRVAPIAEESTGGLLDTPSQFAPMAALDVDGTLVNGLTAGGIPTLQLDQVADVAFEFPFTRRLDPATVTLLLGRDHMAASLLPLGADSRLPLWPPAPVLAPLDGPTVTAGNYQVTPVSYRFGLPRELDRPPPGMLALELAVDVTAVPVEEAGAFGLGFSTRTQLFLTGSDGYLQQSDNHDWVFFEPNESARLGATFYVPEGWRPRPLTVTVRSLDEITAITSDRWVEVTFVVDPQVREEDP